MITARWVDDLWSLGPAYGETGTDREAVAEIRAGDTPDENNLPPKRPGKSVDLICDRRGHLLGRIYPTSRGLLAWVIYDSGRGTRRMEDDSVLHTLKYRHGRAFLLAGTMVGSDARCDCTTIPMTKETRSALQILGSDRPRRLTLPSALCPFV